jgi:putative flippase GtrA
MKSKFHLNQFFLYAFIGLIINLFYFFLFIILNEHFDSPKIIMTIIYFMGSVTGFIANRNVTFHHQGKIGKTGLKFILIQILGYILNFILLSVFFDWLNFSLLFVQCFAIIIVALFLFTLSRIYVFKS